MSSRRVLSQTAVYLLCILAFSACKSTPDETNEAFRPDQETSSTPDQKASGDDQQTTAAGLDFKFPEQAGHPRWSPDASKVVVHAGVEGARSIYIVEQDSTARLELGEGDFVDPTFSRDGTRVVYSASTPDTRGFDLHVYALETGTIERLTHAPGDEREPVVNPLLFGFYAVENGVCGGVASGVPVDSYEKVLFVHQDKPGAPRSIRHLSMKPTSNHELYPRDNWPPENIRQSSPSGTHAGLITDTGDCHSPRFSGDGLHAIWSCQTDNSSVRTHRLAFDDNFEEVLNALEKNRSCEVHWSESKGWQTESCFDTLPRRYSTLEMERTFALEAVSDAAFSANQIEIAAATSGRALKARRKKGSEFERLEGSDFPPNIRTLSWSPDGSAIAVEAHTTANASSDESGSHVSVHPVKSYLQHVTNLYDFPELWEDSESKLLEQNQFVARPSAEKEFYVAYEKTRYAQRPIFVTADAALQAFRDEFQSILQRAETRAAEDLRLLTRALMEHFAAQNNPTSRYLAIYFATAWVPLEAASRLEEPTFDDLVASKGWGEPPEDSDRPTLEEMRRPGTERILDKTSEVISEIPADIRRHVRRMVDSIYSSSSTGKLSVPGFASPVNIDWTQFRPRGPYAEGDLVGYFYAMSWFGQAPLPFEKDALDGLLAFMKSGSHEGVSWWERWRRTDSLVGAFMGKPGAATPEHVQTFKQNAPDKWRDFDPAVVKEELEELRGPVALRDLDAALGDGERVSLKIMLFPKRVGLDTTFFRSLIHPDVDQRFVPTPLDAFAVLGSEAALRNATRREKGQRYFETYKKTLGSLQKEHGALETTDIYHAWLAVLATLATTDNSRQQILDYARSEAWADRLLHSSLVGYTQLKHSAVLYNMMDMSAECDGQQSVYFLSERPLVPKPRGTVDPVPEFFEQLARLAGRVYADINDGREPKLAYWDKKRNHINAKIFAEDLAKIASKAKKGEELNEAEYAWIRSVGGRLETLLIQEKPMNHGIATSSEARLERGIAIATDIHTLVNSKKALQLGVGRLLALWVAVPDGVGSRMTQGHLASYYEFLHPMSDRLTDEAWHTLITNGQAPKRPEWTSSFIEE